LKHYRSLVCASKHNISSPMVIQDLLP